LLKNVYQEYNNQTWNEMILTQILQPDCIKVPVESRDKEAVITELVDLLDANGLLLDRDIALDAVITRERIQSTGTGAGIAIPHGKCNAVKELVMAIGIAHEPIDFNSIDGKQVTILILMVSPADQTGPHIQALATISRLMLNGEFRQQLEKVTSSDEVYELLNNQQN
jgi:fructose-specific phosphotransferase system IIA component